MITVQANGQQVAFPKNAPWAIFNRNEYYVDKHGHPVPDISCGFGPYMDLCIYTSGIIFTFPKVYAGYEVADQLERCINAQLHQNNITVDLVELCKDAMEFRQHVNEDLIIEQAY